MSVTLPEIGCQCCGSPNPDDVAFMICTKCGWEQDDQATTNKDEVLGGPNSDYSLLEARDNYKQHGTSYRTTDPAHERFLNRNKENG